MEVAIAQRVAANEIVVVPPRRRLGDAIVAIFRVLISALIVGAAAFGNTLQASVSNGQPATSWQIKSALLGGIVLALNDIKSRLTPTPTESK